MQLGRINETPLLLLSRRFQGGPRSRGRGCMTQPGPGAAECLSESESAALTEWHCGRWPGQVGPLKAPASGQAPATAARGPARNRAGLADSEPESEDPARGPPTASADCQSRWQPESESRWLAIYKGFGPRPPGPGYCSWPTGVPAFRHRRPKVPQLRRPLIATHWHPSFLSSNLSKSLGAEWTRLRKLMGSKVGGLYQLHLRDDPIQADNAEHIPWLGAGSGGVEQRTHSCGRRET